MTEKIFTLTKEQILDVFTAGQTVGRDEATSFEWGSPGKSYRQQLWELEIQALRAQLWELKTVLVYDHKLMDSNEFDKEFQE